jgi:hypothetical protein
MNEVINLYLTGEYDIPQVEVVSDNEYYFMNPTYFDTKDATWLEE